MITEIRDLVKDQTRSDVTDHEVDHAIFTFMVDLCDNVTDEDRESFKTAWGQLKKRYCRAEFQRYGTHGKTKCPK